MTGVPAASRSATQLLVLGGFGLVLADPLGHVLDGVPIAQRRDDLLHGGRVAVELGQQRELVQGQLTGQLPGRLLGLARHPADRQRGPDVLGFAAGGLADPGLARPSLVRREQRRRFLHRGEVPPVAAGVGDQHVQELARLITGPPRIQDTRHLGQPGLQRGRQAPVTLQDAEAAGVVAGDQQRHPHAHLRHRGQELRCQVQVLADVAGVGGELADGDHGWWRRVPRRASGFCRCVHGGSSVADISFGHGRAPFRKRIDGCGFAGTGGKTPSPRNRTGWRSSGQPSGYAHICAPWDVSSADSTTARSVP